MYEYEFCGFFSVSYSLNTNSVSNSGIFTLSMCIRGGDRVKILLIHRWSHLESIGGAEKVFFSMANALSEKHEVTAFGMTQTGNGKPFFNLSSKVSFVHRNHCDAGTKSVWHQLKRLFYGTREQRHRYDQQYTDVAWARMMLPIIEQKKPDVIIAYSRQLARVLLHTLSVACPVVIMFHRSPEGILSNLTVEDKETLEKAACVQVLMPNDISFVKNRLNCRRVICIPNAVKTSGYKSDLRSHKIVYVGRFSKGDKRPHVLIQAAHLLHKDFPDWIIEFWGGVREQNPAYARKCYEMVKKYRLEECVQFKGTTHDVSQKLAQGSIFAFPSSEEGMPLALLEAMEVGLPAVGFQSCHAVNEIIQNGVNGILCEDGVTPFAEALKSLMESEGVRKKLGANTRTTVAAYAPENVWQAWDKLLQQVHQES